MFYGTLTTGIRSVTITLEGTSMGEFYFKVHHNKITCRT